jgi:hypothetical protein
MNSPLSRKTRYLEPILVYLVYLIEVAPETGSLKTEDFPDQKRAPSTPNSSIYNRNPFSQAGRRGFDPRLPLQLFNNLQDTFTPCSVCAPLVSGSAKKDLESGRYATLCVLRLIERDFDQFSLANKRIL